MAGKRRRKRSRPWWASRYRQELWEQDKTCHWCKRQTLYDANSRTGHGRQRPRSATIEHVIPLSEGGTWDKKNLVLACRKCNKTRACGLAARAAPLHGEDRGFESLLAHWMNDETQD